MTTLKQILEIPRFSELHVLNEHADLERPLDTVEISETPDVSDYIPKNALIITTAMVFQNNMSGLSSFIRSLVNVSAAGIAIKVGRFLPSLDQEVLDTANELNFPIIQIPVNMTLGDLGHKLLSHLWDDQTEQIFFSLEMQQKFVNLMIHGASADTLLKQLGSMIKQSIFLIDPFGSVVSSSVEYSSYELINSKEKKKKLLKKITEYQRSKQKDTFLFEITKDTKTLISVFPIGSDYYFPFMLVIFDVEKLPYPFSQFAIQQAITVLTLTLYKEQTLKNEKRAERKELLTYLLTHKKITAESEWLEYKKHFPVLNSNYYRVVYMECVIPSNKQYHSKEIDKLIYDYLYFYIEKNNEEIKLFPTEHLNQWVLIVQQKGNILPILEEIHGYLAIFLEVFVRFGIGNPVNTIDLIHYSYNESKNALEEEPEGNGFVYQNKIQGLKQLTENVSDEDVNFFCVSILKNLAFPVTQIDIELRKTLSVYLSKQCEITKTAEELFVHRNTVKYRIKKCEELFNTPINDPEFSLQLRVALYLSEPEAR
ncbi:PucR family transcriptional regulator [Enterococcus sp. LJL99]